MIQFRSFDWLISTQQLRNLENYLSLGCGEISPMIETILQFEFHFQSPRSWEYVISELRFPSIEGKYILKYIFWKYIFKQNIYLSKIYFALNWGITSFGYGRDVRWVQRASPVKASKSARANSRSDSQMNLFKNFCWFLLNCELVNKVKSIFSN